MFFIHNIIRYRFSVKGYLTEDKREKERKRERKRRKEKGRKRGRKRRREKATVYV